MPALRKLAQVVGAGHRTKWLLLVMAGLAVTGLEIIGAGLVFALITLVSNPGEDVDLPLLGDPVEILPFLSGDHLALAITGAVAVFFIVRAGFLVGQTYLHARIVNNAAADIGTRLVRGYLSMPYVMHLERNSAELVRNAFYNVQTVKSSLLAPAVDLVAESLVVIGLMVVLLWIAPVATVSAILLFGPLVWFLLRWVKPRMKAYGRGAKDAESRGLELLQQGTAGIRDVRILGAEAQFSRRYRRTRRNFANLQTRRSTLSALPRVLIETSLVLFIAGFFATVLWVDTSGPGALSVLGVFAYVGMRLKPSVQKIVSSVNTVRFAIPSLDDIAEDLTVTAPFARDDGATRADGEVPPLERAVTLEGVRFNYRNSDRPALAGVDLTIERGTSIGICGPTGGGKSTLVDVIAGLLEPTAGAVKVDGVDIHENIYDWYRQLGVVSQAVFLLDDTLRRNIALGLPDREIDEWAVAKAVALAQLGDVVRELPEGLDTRLGERGTRLSGGQRQRVAIARALYRDPQMLIFDEGTSALDNQTESDLVEALTALHGQRTLVMVAHRLTTVRHCDRIYVIENGRVTDQGGFTELVDRHPLFASMRETPSSA